MRWLLKLMTLCFSRTCQGSFDKKRNKMSEHVRNISGSFSRWHAWQVHPDFPERISLSMTAIWIRFKTKTLESLRNIIFCSRMLFGILLSFLKFSICWVLPRTLSFEEVFCFLNIWRIYIWRLRGTIRSEPLNGPNTKSESGDFILNED